MTWIPVSERLPENEDEVLVYSDYYGWQVAIYSSDGYWLLIERGVLIGISHWRPLPEPPEKEGAWSKS